MPSGSTRPDLDREFWSWAQHHEGQSEALEGYLRWLFSDSRCVQYSCTTASMDISGQREVPGGGPVAGLRPGAHFSTLAPFPHPGPKPNELKVKPHSSLLVVEGVMVPTRPPGALT